MDVWTFVLFTKETACEHENVQLWKKMLSLVSSHDQYWESKRTRSLHAADQLLLIIFIIFYFSFILLRARKKLVQEGSNYLFGKSLLLKPLAAFGRGWENLVANLLTLESQSHLLLLILLQIFSLFRTKNDIASFSRNNFLQSNSNMIKEEPISDVHKLFVFQTWNNIRRPLAISISMLWSAKIINIEIISIRSSNEILLIKT